MKKLLDLYKNLIVLNGGLIFKIVM